MHVVHDPLLERQFSGESLQQFEKRQRHQKPTEIHDDGFINQDALVIELYVAKSDQLKIAAYFALATRTIRHIFFRIASKSAKNVLVIDVCAKLA